MNEHLCKCFSVDTLPVWRVLCSLCVREKERSQDIKKRFPQSYKDTVTNRCDILCPHIFYFQRPIRERLTCLQMPSLSDAMPWEDHLLFIHWMTANGTGEKERKWPRLCTSNMKQIFHLPSYPSNSMCIHSFLLLRYNALLGFNDDKEQRPPWTPLSMEYAHVRNLPTQWATRVPPFNSFQSCFGPYLLNQPSNDLDSHTNRKLFVSSIHWA